MKNLIKKISKMYKFLKNNGFFFDISLFLLNQISFHLIFLLFLNRITKRNKTL